MLVRYRGGRPVTYTVPYNRKPLYFSKENNWTLDIPEQAIRDHIFSLRNSHEFESIERPIVPEVKEVVVPKKEIKNVK